MYALTGADQGSTIRVVVTASGPGGVVARATDATATVEPASSDPVPDPPVNEVAPTITGTARAGNTLQVERGHWTGTDPISYTYQWQRCDADGTNCVNVDGATSLEYALTDADVGHTLRIVARGTNAAGTSSVISTPTAVVGPAGTTSGGGGNPRPVPTPAPTSSPTPGADDARGPVRRDDHRTGAGHRRRRPLLAAGQPGLVGLVRGARRRRRVPPDSPSPRRARSACACGPTPPSCRPRRSA